MPYKVKGNCVYKKDDGTKVGCTKGSMDKYLAALHANTDESIKENDNNPTDVVKMDVPFLIRVMEYAKEDAKTDMDLHSATEKMIALSTKGKVLSMSDYDSIFTSKKEELSETKIFIKKLLRENMNDASGIPSEIQQELQRLGVNPNDAYVMIDNDMQTEGLGDAAKKSFGRFKSYAQALAKPLIVCSVLAGAISCQKNNPYVYKFSYHIDKEIDSTQQTNHNGVILTPYSPQEQVGSWYELEDHKLSEQERQAMEEELAAQEKARITGKDYTITDYKLELVGQSKRGDIETTDGYK